VREGDGTMNNGQHVWLDIGGTWVRMDTVTAVQVIDTSLGKGGVDVEKMSVWTVGGQKFQTNQPSQLAEVLLWLEGDTLSEYVVED
jgi:hypothetical protein